MDTCDDARSRSGFMQVRKLGDAPWALTEIENQFGLESSTLHPSHMFSFVALRRRFEGEPVSLCTNPSPHAPCSPPIFILD
jgi:hypothetical protein